MRKCLRDPDRFFRNVSAQGACLPTHPKIELGLDCFDLLEERKSRQRLRPELVRMSRAAGARN